VGHKSVLRTRAGIGSWTKAEADKVAEHAMGLSTQSEIKEYLKTQVKALV